MLLTSPWRLSLLFLVSGVATGYLLERQGVRGFLGRRSVRLLVPLVFGMLVIVPPQSYLEVVEKVQYAGSYADFWGLYLTAYQGFCRDGDCLILPTWNHLWFVAYLWVYTLLLYAFVRAAPGVRAAAARGLERRFVGLGVLLGRSCISLLRACCSPRVSRRRTRSSTIGTTMRSTSPCSCSALRWSARGRRGKGGAPALARARSRRARLGVSLRLARALRRRRAAAAVVRLAAALAARVQCADLARDRGRARLRAPASAPRQRGAPLSHDGRFSRLHPAPDRDRRCRARAAAGAARPACSRVSLLVLVTVGGASSATKPFGACACCGRCSGSRSSAAASVLPPPVPRGAG